MPGKYLTRVVRHFLKAKRAFMVAGFAVAAFLPAALADDTNSPITQPKFLGSQSCSSSSCHGGAGEKSNQYTIWSTHDFHHARPYATLETARSERLAEVLKIGPATQSARCTVCHAPFQTVPAERLGRETKITEGVSCETCHGPAENWIRSHTRPDYTHADRVAAGMRDLKNLYVRANTCVACHQNLDPEIRAAGHPELIFELDGQSVTMPRHWPKSEDKPGPQIWLVSQAVALREMSWQVSEQTNKPPQVNSNAVAGLSGLSWVLNNLGAFSNSLPSGQFPGELPSLQQPGEKLAIEVADLTWSDQMTREILGAVASTSQDFTDTAAGQPIQARRAERLVLALDRLTLGLSATATNASVNESLNKLFADAQSLPDFDPKQFAKDLNTFHSSVASFLESK